MLAVFRLPRLFLISTIYLGCVTWAMADEAPCEGDSCECKVSSADHHVQVHKKLDPKWIDSLTAKGQRKVYRGKELETIGMPCGGVCAGQLYVRGDGTLAKWWIANNAYNTGVWWVPYEDRSVDYAMETPLGTHRGAYRTFRPASYVEQGFAIRVQRDGDQPLVRTLDRDGFDDIRFIGEYPIATIEYRDKAKPALPVEVQAEVFSPFIPLNVRDSANPVTILRYWVTNNSDKPADVSIAGWLQNAVCLEQVGRIHAQSRNVVVRHAGLTSVQMDLIPSAPKPGEPRRVTVFGDFEDGTYGDWTVEGEAFGDGPSTGTLPEQQKLAGWEGKYLINTYLGGNDQLQGRLISPAFEITQPYITFLIGGGNHKGRTCMNLVIDGKVVRTARGTQNTKLSPGWWNVGKLIGKQARFEIVDRESRPWGHITADRICFASRPLETLFPRDHAQFGDMALTALDPTATATAWWDSKEKLLGELAQDGKLRGPAVARAPLGKECRGATCTAFRLQPGQRRDAVFLVSWYFPNRRQDNRGTAWATPSGFGRHVGNMYANWFNSSLDVARYVAEHFERLDRQTHLFRDTYYDTTLPYWFAQRAAMQISTLATETCQWWANGRFYGFEGVGCCQGTCNHVWHYDQATGRIFPSLQRSLLAMQTFNPRTGFAADSGMIRYRGEGVNYWAADGQAGNILMMLREHQYSPNDQFLRNHWPAVRKAIEFLIEKDGNDDGLLEGPQPNTYDIEFFGANTMIGSLYLATLRAGEEMALVVDDKPFAERCRRIYLSGQKLTIERLFNDEYFVQEVDLEKHPDWQYGDGCLADQLLGQTWAHQLGLGHLYPEAPVRSALKSVWKYNWATDVGPQNKAHRPEIIYADQGEAGLLVCTWPNSPHKGPKSVRYRNTVWTGVEFQVAAGMIHEGLITEGLAIARAIHDRYAAEKHNPWNLLLCGDHYSRAMASWGCLLAASGYTYDGPAGKLGFAPQLSPEDFKAFFTAAEGWGNLVQQRKADRQINRLELKWGTLRLKTLQLQLPPGAKLGNASVTAADRPLEITTNQHDDRVEITLAEPHVIKTNQALAVEMSFRQDEP